jgi:hypothetical protein
MAVLPDEALLSSVKVHCYEIFTIGFRHSPGNRAGEQLGFLRTPLCRESKGKRAKRECALKRLYRLRAPHARAYGRTGWKIYPGLG